ncbi:MAG: MauE/DoxX family redox-associated membrane protein [Candidatus Marinimicrobia bacterium]|nr:MauE/DoxX family redox-associated membrane protein [Candidatus Neomarinimicrobiota bacterium]MDP6727150.1 MauE/DoxX family redox-associated membrane protein [Candidatus Neomarinimicrobiota bacterium]|tara:strand:- start:69 stop:518 length:450 start_codon:yes stop_codon:yes gene_type:complete
MKNNFKNILVMICRICLGFMFVYASLDKIAHPEEFAKQIGYYKALPFGLENVLAIVLPWTELIVGICLLAGLLVDGATLLSIIMMLVFILAISQAMLRGIDITCGCFKVSADSDKLGLDTIIRDIVFLVMSFIVLNRQERKFEFLPKSD